MANNYTMASFKLKMTEDQAQWIMAAVECADDNFGPRGDKAPVPPEYATFIERLCADGLEHSGCEHLQYDDGGLWIAGMESFNPEYVAILLHESMSAFNVNEPVSFAFAEICDKPRLDEFGGGAAVVSHAGIEWLHTASWVEQTINEITESQLV
jgi:hypothetical protein